MALLYEVVDCSNVYLTDVPINDSDYNIIEDLVNAYDENIDSSIRKYTIEYSTNCCDLSLIDVPVHYNFNSRFVSYSSTGTGLSSRSIYTFLIEGIDNSFIQNIELSYNNITYNPVQIQKVPEGFIITVDYRQIDTIIPSTPTDPFPTAILSNYIKIITIDNFEYAFRIDFTLGYPGLGNVIDVNTVLLSKPLFPSQLQISNDLELNLNLLYENGEELLTGIYNIIICKWYKDTSRISNNILTECKQKSHFVDCGIECLIVDKLVKCRNSNVHHLYKMLQYTNDCDTSLESRCDLYKSLVNKLIAPDCNDPNDDCKCQDCNNGGTPYPYSFNNSIRKFNQLYKSCGTCGSNKRK